jgi:hypothetical protein
MKKILEIFKDDNDWNEKTIVGFLAFVVMVGFAVTDLVTGLMQKELVISDTIYNSYVIIVLGAFGIAEVGKIWGKDKKGGEE